MLYNFPAPFEPEPEPKPVPLSNAERLAIGEIELEVFAMNHFSTAQEYRGEVPDIAGGYDTGQFVPNKYASSRLIPHFVKDRIAKWHEEKAVDLISRAAGMSIAATIDELEVYLNLMDNGPANETE